MKTAIHHTLWFLTGFLCGGILVFAGGVFYLRHNLISEEESRFSFEETVKIFPVQVQKHGEWIVRTVPCGLPAPVRGERIAVFEICSRKYATSILQDPAARKTAAVLPCKIAIYEKDEKVWIARLNALVFMNIIGGTASDVFIRKILPEQFHMLYNILK